MADRDVEESGLLDHASGHDGADDASKEAVTKSVDVDLRPVSQIGQIEAVQSYLPSTSSIEASARGR